MKRKTIQRDAIMTVLIQEDRPLTVEEILRIGRTRVKTLNPATVYRNLKLLVANESVRIIHHPGVGIRYERAGKGHHHHFHCHSCDRLFELPGCALNEKKFSPPGFVTEGHGVFLYGVCPSCTGLKPGNQ